MAAEYSYPITQNVAVNENILFLNGDRCCKKGFIVHNDASGVFRLKGICKNCAPRAIYKVNFHANVAVAPAADGGVLEPVGALPVIIEDNVFIGGNCGVYEGVLVKERAVLGSGVIINKSTALYDAVNGCWIRPDADGRMVVPEGAVVVAGSRPVTKGPGAEAGIHLYTPVIVKYRDGKTDASTVLEDLLR